MPPNCSVKDCTARYSGDDPLRFFRLPADKKHRELGVHKLKRIEEKENDWKPRPQEGLCSKHFVTGNRSKDKTYRDYHPTQNLEYVTHWSTVVVRARRARK